MKRIHCLILLIFLSVNIYSQSRQNLYEIERDGKRGYVDTSLNIVIEPIYDEVGIYKESEYGGFLIVRLNQKDGIVNTKGEQILELEYNNLGYTALPGVFRFKKDRNFGLIDTFGRVLLEPEYESNIEFINVGKFLIVRQGQEYALLNEMGITITGFKYEFLAGSFNSDICLFKSDGKYGYLNMDGEVIISPVFEHADTFNGDYAIVKVKDKFGIINTIGDFEVQPICDRILYKYSFNSDRNIEAKEKVYYFKLRGKIGIFDENLKTIVGPHFDEIGYFNEGFAYVKQNGKYGFINKKGELAIPLDYENAGSFSEGIAPVVKNGKWGFIDYDNNVKIEFKFTGYIQPFFNGLAAFRKRNSNSSKGHYVRDQCGYIDLNGDVKIPLIYKRAERFFNGVGLVEDSEFVYLIDKESNKILLKSRGPVVFESIQKY